MSSISLQLWQTVRVVELDEIEEAHRQVGGSGRGRRYATQQINHACTMLHSSQFQGFCRDLHDEAVEHIVRAVAHPPLRAVFHADLLLHRKLDRGNPNPGNIGADFNRFGLDFLADVEAAHPNNAERIKNLSEMNRWRNAIAHQEFDRSSLPGTMNLRLATIRRWRRSCDRLAVAFDDVSGNQVALLTGNQPW